MAGFVGPPLAMLLAHEFGLTHLVPYISQDKPTTDARHAFNHQDGNGKDRNHGQHGDQFVPLTNH